MNFKESIKKPKRYHGKCACGVDIFLPDVESLKGKVIKECLNCSTNRIDIEYRENMRQSIIQSKLKNKINPKYFGKNLSDWISRNEVEKNNKVKCDHYIKNPHTWFLFYGPVGTGKTMMLNIIAAELIKDGFDVFIENFNSLCIKYYDVLQGRVYDGGRVMTLTQWLDDVLSHDYILIDEFARNDYSESNKKFAFELVNGVYNRGGKLGLVHNGDDINKLSKFLETDRFNEMARGMKLHFYGKSRR